MRAPVTSLCLALSGFALAVPAAHAQDLTRIDVEYSFDNVTWAGGVATLSPSTQPIYFRVRLTHQGPTPVAGFADASMQPLFTRGASGFPVSLVPLPLSTANGAGSANNTGLPANLGRMNPFAAAPMTDGSGTGLLTSINGIYAGEGVLRYCGSRAEIPELVLDWGVRFTQLPPQIAGTSFQQGSSAVVFKCAASIQGTIQPILYYVDVPLSLIGTPGQPGAVRWYTSAVGGGNPRLFLVDPANIHPVTVWVGGNPCSPGFSGGYTRAPKDMAITAGRRASFAPEVLDCGILGYQWSRNGVPLSNNARIQGATSKRLIIDNATVADAGTYSINTQFSDGWQSRSAMLTVSCPADIDNGSGSGLPDQAVDINDLLYFLTAFEAGTLGADLDDGMGQGLQDNAVDINDLLYFLTRFELGC